jgi:ppGpp synthetase/RelA/SpoT-type nucleotidyltranferase
MSLITEQFVQQYEERRCHYTLRATRAEQTCREILSSHQIPAIVSSRAKCPIRLRQKLEERDAELHYSTDADIYSNIFDLSGVRIAVYLPSHVQKVSRLLQHAFIPRLVRVYSPKPKPAAQHLVPKIQHRAHATKEPFALPGVRIQHITRPTGYCATHLHVLLKPEALGGERDSTGAGAQVEIQLTSLLMHTWSEVEHDLVYKEVGGKSSEEETEILNEINECAATGEALLRRLEEAVASREERDRKVERRCGRL